MRASKETIKNQSEFVMMLSNRLGADILPLVKSGSYDGHHTIQDDIKRLRRELMELSRMFDSDYQ